MISTLPKLRKIDLTLALIIGELSALMMIFVGRNLSQENAALALIMPYTGWLLLVFPILCAGGLHFAYFLNKIFGHFLFQLGKFGLVGGLNFLLDAAVLNFFIFTTGIAAGIIQSGFKSVSFFLCVINSYLWNKRWTFNAAKNEKTTKEEFSHFVLVSLIGFFLNVGIDYALVNMVTPFWSMPPKTWAQFSGIMSAAISLNWNFIGYKFFVFGAKNKKEIENEQNSLVPEIPA